MDSSTSSVKQDVWKWIDEMVIAEQFCPFAKAPRKQNGIELVEYTDKQIDGLIQIFVDKCHELEKNHTIETSLIICSNSLEDFYDYLDVLAIIQEQAHAFDGQFQLASFHPNYRFEGEAPASLSHYTNRAPYPIFHILREASISQVLQTFSEPDVISDAIVARNIEHAHTLGANFFKKFLK